MADSAPGEATTEYEGECWFTIVASSKDDADKVMKRLMDLAASSQFDEIVEFESRVYD